MITCMITCVHLYCMATNNNYVHRLQVNYVVPCLLCLFFAVVVMGFIMSSVFTQFKFVSW